MLKPGKKTLEWARVRAKLKVRFQLNGITRCEATFPHQCWHTSGLSFGHSKKRADIVGNEIEECALLCPTAHEHVEALGKKEMHSVILGIIANRERRP